MSTLKHNYKFYYIYKIVNLINKKCYVGFHATNNEYDNYFGSSATLNNAIKKYGYENFIMGIIEHINPNEWQEKEIYWIKEMKSHVSEWGYNQTIGGDGRVGACHTEETKIKIKNAHKGRYVNKTWKERYGEEIAKQMKLSLIKSLSGENSASFGKKRTEETKHLMSIASKGKSKSKEHRKNIGLAQQGKTWEEKYGIETANNMKQMRKTNKKECKYCHEQFSPNVLHRHEEKCKLLKKM